MKVVLISGEFPPLVGGVADYTYQLSLSLSAENAETFVITSEDFRIPKSIENRVIVMPIVKKWNVLGVLSVIRAINKIKPDWILLQYVPHMYSRITVPLPICLLGAILGFSYYRLLTVFHEIAIRFDFARPKYLLPAFFQRIIALILSLSSERVVVSIERYRRMLWFFDRKISKIPIGSSILPVNMTENEKRALRNKVAFSGETIIATFGKNPRRADLLLEVTKELKDQGIAVKALFIGAFAQDWIERMKAKAEDLKIDNSLCFPGFLKSDDVYRYLLISDLFVFLEGVDPKGRGGVSIKSTVIAAAFAAGLPIIADKGDMSDEFFKDKENIFLLKTLKIEEIVNSVKRIIQDSELRNRLKIGSLRTYNECLQWPAIARRYLDLMRKESH